MCMCVVSDRLFSYVLRRTLCVTAQSSVVALMQPQSVRDTCTARDRLAQNIWDETTRTYIVLVEAREKFCRGRSGRLYSLFLFVCFATYYWYICTRRLMRPKSEDAYKQHLARSRPTDPATLYASKTTHDLQQQHSVSSRRNRNLIPTRITFQHPF